MVTAAMKLKDVYSLEGLDAWGWCTGTTQRDGMGREEGSGWGTHVYLWWIHFDIWQNQYNIVKFKNKIKFLKKEKKNSILLHQEGRGREVQRNLYRLPCHFK